MAWPSLRFATPLTTPAPSRNLPFLSGYGAPGAVPLPGPRAPPMQSTYASFLT